jgi:predicted dienelactone hydrolase
MRCRNQSSLQAVHFACAHAMWVTTTEETAVRVAVGMVAVVTFAAAPIFAANAGFTELKFADGAESPLVAGIWYPTNAPTTQHSLGGFTQNVAPGAPIAGARLPLVVMSHGGGGWYGGHYDTALALARAGFVVAAVSHAGDTFDDQSKVQELWRRPAQLHRLLDYMLKEWPERGRLDVGRVGAFGFSNGGFTVLVAAGGVPDLSKVGPYCRAHPSQDLCQAIKHAAIDPHFGADVPASAWVHDRRIKAVVIAAPAFGFAFGRAGLSRIGVPVQIWRAAEDRHQPNPYFDEAVRADLPRPPEYHVVRSAGHYDFLPPCDARLSAQRPDICSSLPGFDRAAFHEEFNAQVVRFFQAELR